VVRFIENSHSFNQLNNSRVDIRCVLENDVGEAPRQPVILYITVNITPPNLYNSPPGIATEDEDSPAKENTWEGAVGRIKWVMDTLSQVTEVREYPSDSDG